MLTDLFPIFRQADKLCEPILATPYVNTLLKLICGTQSHLYNYEARKLRENQFFGGCYIYIDY